MQREPLHAEAEEPIEVFEEAPVLGKDTDAAPNPAAEDSGSQQMSDKGEDAGEFERIAKIGNDVGSVLGADTVRVKLLNGGEIVGGLVGFAIRKKEGRRGGESTWSGNVRLQTDPGELQIDCLTIESITPN
jgi:hypothetical protein